MESKKITNKQGYEVSGQAGNRFTSGENLTEKEFKQGIEKAEKGAFFTVQESMNRFEKWLKTREKK